MPGVVRDPGAGPERAALQRRDGRDGLRHVLPPVDHPGRADAAHQHHPVRLLLGSRRRQRQQSASARRGLQGVRRHQGGGGQGHRRKL